VPETGREAGRRLQPQNLPRPLIKIKPEHVEELVSEIKRGDTAALQRRIPEGHTLTDLLVGSLRYTITARVGMLLAVGDFSMIEACVVLALAKQWDKVELILSNQDPYRDMGAAIFKLSQEQRKIFIAVAKEEMTAEQDWWRFAGKTGVLSCGFSVSAKGLHDKNPQLSLEECQEIVDTYRNVWAPKVPKLWKNLRYAAHAAMRNSGHPFPAECGVEYFFDQKATRPALICRLLNGKEIFYPEPEIKLDENYGKPEIFFSAVKDHKFTRVKAWHGLLTENIVSAHAREIQVGAIQNVQNAGYRVILSVHDEVVAEGPDLTKAGMEALMSKAPQWAVDAGIPIAVEAFITKHYRK
jgi:DNA polymerase